MILNCQHSDQNFWDGILDRWEEGLNAYLEQPELISRHVRAAREIIRRRFSVPVIAERWKALFELV